jgi:hypothetical protein
VLIRSYAVTGGRTAPRVFVGNTDAEKFEAEYFEKTGKRWINVPRGPAINYVWNMEAPGSFEMININRNFSGKVETYERKLTLLAKTPKILYIEDFLSHEECDYIISTVVSQKSLKRSTVKDIGELDSKRTSSNAWLECDFSQDITDICKRIYKLAKIPFDLSNFTRSSESFQVIHYGETQEYQVLESQLC